MRSGQATDENGMPIISARIAPVSTLTADRAVAEHIAAHLVDMRLAAATHLLGPSGSTYRYGPQGVQQAEEWIVEAVTSPSRAEAVAAAIIELHDYILPSITVTFADTTAGLADWARAGSGGTDA